MTRVAPLAFPLMAAALLACAGGERPAVAAEPSDVLQQVRVGFEGAYVVGRWTPCVVTVELPAADRVRLVVTAPDPQGNRADFPAEWTDVEAGSPQRLRTHFVCGRRPAVLGVRLESESGTLAETTLGGGGDERARSLRKNARLIATLGQPEKMSSTGDPFGEENATGARARHVVALDSAGELPVTARGYDGLDLLVVAGNYGLDLRRSKALRDWVQGGGRLLLSVGRGLDPYRQSPLAGWVPFSIGPDTIPVRDLSSVESFAGRSTRIPMFGPVRVPRVDPAGGEVLLASLSQPLLVSTAVGFGRVTLLALDLNETGVLARWSGMPDFTNRLLGREDRNEETSSQGGRLAYSGVSDMATQLQTSLEDVEQVDRSSSWRVLGLLLLYMAVIGPLDYLLVHRLLRKPALTWLTFPAIVLGAALLSTWSARAGNGNTLRVNRLEVLDYDATAGIVRGHAWQTVYSPNNQRYDVEVQPTAEEPSALALSWFGVPEQSFGGMYRQGGLELGRLRYGVSADRRSLSGYPVPVWGTRTVHARWQRNDAWAPVDSRLFATPAGRLSGTVTHRLPGDLSDWMLAFGGQLYLPREAGQQSLPPGAVLEVDARELSQRDLRGYLTGVRATVVEGERPTETEVEVYHTAYDALDHNPLRIVRSISYYEAMGGRSYTGLTHHPLAALDLSHVLRADRAVLIGRLDAPVSALRLDGARVEASRRDTFVRIVLPVRRTGPGADDLIEPDDAND